MAANLFLVVSGDPKWPQTTFWSFRAKRCDPEPPPHLFKRWIEGWRRVIFIANRSSLGIAASPTGRVGAYRIRPFRRPAGPNTDTGVPLPGHLWGVCNTPLPRYVYPSLARTGQLPSTLHSLLSTLHSLPSTLYPLLSTLYPLRFTTRTPCRTSMCPAPSSSARSLRGQYRRRRPAGRCNGRCA